MTKPDSLTPLVRQYQQIKARHRGTFDLRDADSKLSAFLRYYREVYRGGTMDDGLITVA